MINCESQKWQLHTYVKFPTHMSENTGPNKKNNYCIKMISQMKINSITHKMTAFNDFSLHAFDFLHINGILGPAQL
jgi:hypothetical protein